MPPTTRIRTVLVLTAVTMLGTLLGCTSPPSEVAAGSTAYDAAPQGAPADAAHPEVLRQEDGSGPPADQRMVIVNRTLRLQVKDTDAAVDQLRTLVGAHQGTITDLEVASGDSWVYGRDTSPVPLRGWVSVRVPSSSYDKFAAEAAGLGEVIFQSESSSDVTQEHIDLSARLKNLRAQEERLRDFFTAAKNVEEMLAVEKELTRLRGDIESLDAQVTHLERQAAMVTVTVELTEPDGVVSPAGQSWGFVEAITNGLRGAVALMNGAVAFTIATSPVWLVALLVFFPVRAWFRRRKMASPAKP